MREAYLELTRRLWLYFLPFTAPSSFPELPTTSLRIMTILRQAVRQQKRSLASLTHTPTQRPLLLEDYSPAEQAKLPQFTISRERG